MDWIVQTLAVAGFTILVLGITLFATVSRLRGESQVSGRHRPLPGVEGDPETLLAALRPRLFEQGVDVGHPAARGDRLEVTLGFRGQRWRLELHPEHGGVLVGPDGPDGELLAGLITGR
jgi:hypothetical protein